MELIRKSLNKISPYIPGKPIDELKRELGIKGEIIKLASNENPLGPSPLAINAVRKELNNLNFYPDDNVFYLKKKISNILSLSPENIIVGNGSVELIHLVVKAFLNPGEKILMSKPSFIMGKIEGEVFDGKIVEIPTIDCSVDFEGLLSNIDKETKIVYIDNPNNPIGCIIGKRDADRIVDAIGNDKILIFDEAYKEYIERDDFPETLRYIDEKKNVVIMRTFSKIYGLAGLRVGYAIARKEIINYLSRVRLPFNVNSLAQVAAIAALDDKEHLKNSRKLVSEGKKFLYDAFAMLKIKYIPSEGNFITIDCKRDTKEIFEKLLKEGIIVRPLHQYGLDTLLRITIGKERENHLLIDALSKFF